MLYALIDKDMAVAKGFSEITHNVYDDGCQRERVEIIGR